MPDSEANNKPSLSQIVDSSNKLNKSPQKEDKDITFRNKTSLNDSGVVKVNMTSNTNIHRDKKIFKDMNNDLNQKIDLNVFNSNNTKFSKNDNLFVINIKEENIISHNKIKCISFR